MQGATVIDLSAYREHRRATAAAKTFAGAAPTTPLFGWTMVPIAFMVMWTPVWLAPRRGAIDDE